MVTGHVFIATSLDGYIARLDGDIEWLLSRDNPLEDHGYEDFIKDIDGIVMGRGTFEKVLGMGPWPYTKPVVVLSKTLSVSSIPSELAGRIEVSPLSIHDLLAQLSTRSWNKVYVDGGQVIQSFLREGKISTLTITSVPVLIGQGRSLFGAVDTDLSLRHLETRSFPSGLVQSRYEVLPCKR